MAHNNLMLIAQLSGFHLHVLANSLGCDTDLARKVHDKLATVLATMIGDQRKILAAEGALVEARGTSHKEDAFFDLHHYRTSYFETWLVETVALLDEYLIDDLTHEYFNFRTGSWYRRDSEVPIVVPVPTDKLCGLAEIIARIEDSCGVRFSVDHVYYSEAEAEAAWWESTGEDPDVFFRMKEVGGD